MDIVKERMMQLGQARENMSKLADIIKLVDNSQLKIEKYAFDSINTSDKVLAISKEGNRLVNLLSSCCKEYISDPEALQKQSLEALIGNLERIFIKLSEEARSGNEALHSMEHEIAGRGDDFEDAKKAVEAISNAIDDAAACCELLTTDKNS